MKGLRCTSSRTIVYLPLIGYLPLKRLPLKHRQHVATLRLCHGMYHAVNLSESVVLFIHGRVLDFSCYEYIWQSARSQQRSNCKNSYLHFTASPFCSEAVAPCNTSAFHYNFNLPTFLSVMATVVVICYICYWRCYTIRSCPGLWFHIESHGVA